MGGFGLAGAPRQDGRLAVITGGNSGIGWEAAWMLASLGARVILACRDPGRAEDAVARLRARVPSAEVEAMALDLASLASVRRFAELFRARHPRLDLLVNNAGVMALPRRLTEDGFEMQLGTNHLGHFALTGLLLEALVAAPGARVVTVSSLVHVPGRIAWDDLDGEKRYGKWPAYFQSKLANLLFVRELARRLATRHPHVLAVACHPGYSATNLQAVGPQMEGSAFLAGINRVGNSVLAQSAERGALPTVYAAVGTDVENGDFTGPNGLFEVWGRVARKVAPAANARDDRAAERLWSVSELRTGVSYLGAP